MKLFNDFKKIFFFTLVFFLSQGLLAKAMIYFPSVIEVTKKENYSFYDIAIFQKGNLNELDELKKVKLEHLSKESILKTSKEFQELFQVKVSESIEFHQTGVFSKAEISRKVQNHLTSGCNECIFEIHLTQFPSNPKIDLLIQDSFFEKKGASFLLPLKSKSEAQVGWVSGTWKNFKKVSVVNKWISQNSRLQVQDLSEELKEVTFINDKIPLTQDIIGKRVQRALSAGTVVTSDVLVVEKDVKKGDSLRVKLINDAIEIETQGIAESDGQVGDTIKIRLHQKNLNAKVVSKNEVIIE